MKQEKDLHVTNTFTHVGKCYYHTRQLIGKEYESEIINKKAINETISPEKKIDYLLISHFFSLEGLNEELLRTERLVWIFLKHLPEAIGKNLIQVA